MARTKIDDWTLSSTKAEVTVKFNNKTKKTIPCQSFIDKGMILFPKKLYRIICKEARYGKQYDKFWDGVYGQTN